MSCIIMIGVVFFHALWMLGQGSEEIIVTNFGKNQFLRTNEQFDVQLQSYSFQTSGKKIYNFQAREQDGKLMILWVDSHEFATRYIDSSSFMTPTQLTFDKTVSMFDVQTKGDWLVMSTINDTHSTFYLGNLVDSSVEKVLTDASHLKTVAIHPTARVIYYLICQRDKFSLKVYDVVKNDSKELVPAVCFDDIIYDDKNKILWAADGDQIYQGNLNGGKFDVVYQKEKGLISSIALGSDQLFIMHKKQSPSLYNFTLVPKRNQTLPLPSYRITPYIGLLADGKFFILDIDNGLFKQYDKTFIMLKESSITIEKKAVVSLHIIASKDSMELYWIHSNNGGKVETTVINPEGIEINRTQLCFLDDDIIDFTFIKKRNIYSIYLAINRTIYFGEINHSLERQNISKFFDMENTIKAMQSGTSSIMFVSFCDGNGQNGIFVVSTSTGYSLRHDTVECFHNIASISNGAYFTSSNGIYTSDGQMKDSEKLFDISGLTNFAVDSKYAYFVISYPDIRWSSLEDCCYLVQRVSTGFWMESGIWLVVTVSKRDIRLISGCGPAPENIISSGPKHSKMGLFLRRSLFYICDDMLSWVPWTAFLCLVDL